MDRVYKAQRTKLDREQKDRKGEDEEVDEGENEHTVVEWGNKRMCESGKESERERERKHCGGVSDTGKRANIWK